MFLSRTDRTQPADFRGGWRAAMQLHFAQFAYSLQASIVKFISGVIILALAVGYAYVHYELYGS
jgi:hypothetical protein